MDKYYSLHLWKFILNINWQGISLLCAMRFQEHDTYVENNFFCLILRIKQRMRWIISVNSTKSSHGPEI